MRRTKYEKIRNMEYTEDEVKEAMDYLNTVYGAVIHLWEEERLHQEIQNYLEVIKE